MNNNIYGIAMFALVANPSECKGRINKTLDGLDLASFFCWDHAAKAKMSAGEENIHTETRSL